mgnify:CR=1 FL=1
MRKQIESIRNPKINASSGRAMIVANFILLWSCLKGQGISRLFLCSCLEWVEHHKLDSEHHLVFHHCYKGLYSHIIAHHPAGSKSFDDHLSHNGIYVATFISHLITALTHFSCMTKIQLWIPGAGICFHHMVLEDLPNLLIIPNWDILWDKH